MQVFAANEKTPCLPGGHTSVGAQNTKNSAVPSKSAKSPLHSTTAAEIPCMTSMGASPLQWSSKGIDAVTHRKKRQEGPIQKEEETCLGQPVASQLHDIDNEFELEIDLGSGDEIGGGFPSRKVPDKVLQYNCEMQQNLGGLSNNNQHNGMSPAEMRRQRFAFAQPKGRSEKENRRGKWNGNIGDDDFNLLETGLWSP